MSDDPRLHPAGRDRSDRQPDRHAQRPGGRDRRAGLHPGRLDVRPVLKTEADGGPPDVASDLNLDGHVVTGYRGPDTLNFALRHPGRHTVTVRYADGLKREWPVDLSTTTTRTRLRAERGDEF